MPTLLHISDLHAHGGNPASSLADEVAARIAQIDPPVLVVSGDLGHQGSGQDVGARWIARLADRAGISRERIVCCPGNHDLETGNEPSFARYTRAVAELTGRATRASAAPCIYYEIDGIGFLVVNTVYHLDHRYGLVLQAEIARVLEERGSDLPVVCVMHHHLIPQTQRDQSTVGNAYPCLETLARHRVLAVLHGHRHMAMTMRLEEVRVVGVGSIAFTPEPNVNNQFNLVEPGIRIDRFRLIEDATDAGTHWVSASEAWANDDEISEPE